LQAAVLARVKEEAKGADPEKLFLSSDEGSLKIAETTFKQLEAENKEVWFVLFALPLTIPCALTDS
jgi:hypothetical protein